MFQLLIILLAIIYMCIINIICIYLFLISALQPTARHRFSKIRFKFHHKIFDLHVPRWPEMLLYSLISNFALSNGVIYLPIYLLIVSNIWEERVAYVKTRRITCLKYSLAKENHQTRNDLNKPFPYVSIIKKSVSNLDKDILKLLKASPFELLANYLDILMQYSLRVFKWIRIF